MRKSKVYMGMKVTCFFFTAILVNESNQWKPFEKRKLPRVKFPRNDALLYDSFVIL